MLRARAMAPAPWATPTAAAARAAAAANRRNNGGAKGGRNRWVQCMGCKWHYRAHEAPATCDCGFSMRTKAQPAGAQPSAQSQPDGFAQLMAGIKLANPAYAAQVDCVLALHTKEAVDETSSGDMQKAVSRNNRARKELDWATKDLLKAQDYLKKADEAVREATEEFLQSQEGLHQACCALSLGPTLPTQSTKKISVEQPVGADGLDFDLHLGDYFQGVDDLPEAEKKDLDSLLDAFRKQLAEASRNHLAPLDKCVQEFVEKSKKANEEARKRRKRTAPDEGAAKVANPGAKEAAPQPPKPEPAPPSQSSAGESQPSQAASAATPASQQDLEARTKERVELLLKAAKEAKKDGTAFRPSEI